MKKTPSPNLNSDVFNTLKDRIIHWHYPPDYRLTEEVLCEEFGVSRSPVREALQMLVENGLVEKEAHRGYSVKQPDMREIYELYEVRLALEVYVVTLLTKKGIPEVLWQEILDRIQDNATDYAEKDAEFHESLAILTNNKSLIQHLKSINERLQFLRIMDDMYWAERYSSLGKLIRYADDFVIICRTRQDAETALQRVKQIMIILKLTLHPTKTHVVDMGQDGFDFLGFHFHKKKTKKSGKLLPYIWPSQKAMIAVRSKIHFITERMRLSNTLPEVIKFLNRVIRGWRNYFRIGNCTLKFQQLDRFVRYRLEQWVRAKIGSRGHWNELAFRTSMTKHGLEYFYLHGICAVKS